MTAGVTTVAPVDTDITGAEERLGLYGALQSASKLYILRRSPQCTVSSRQRPIHDPHTTPFLISSTLTLKGVSTSRKVTEYIHSIYLPIMPIELVGMSLVCAF